jgi:hypothetical protein
MKHNSDVEFQYTTKNLTLRPETSKLEIKHSLSLNVRYGVLETLSFPTDYNDGTAFFSPFPEYESCQGCVSGCRLSLDKMKITCCM